MARPTPDKRTVAPNGQRIRELRQLAGFSLEDFAEKSGISTGTLGPIERRNKPIFVKTLHEIVKVLNGTKKVTATYQELLLSADEVPKPSRFSRGVFQLPPSLPDFTGREDELARITARLRGGGRSVGVSSALRGMGGIGKTVTAVEACWEVKDDFPDGQLVVELRGMSEQPLTPVQAMAQIIRDFRPGTNKLPGTEKEMLSLYRQVLTGKKALVLLDDAKDEAQVRSLLSVPSVAFVVTSRNALALDGVESIPLGVLVPSEARSVLRAIVGTGGTDDELRTVAELCGGLPLALRVAGDFLRLHENWPLPKYIAALRDESKRLERLKGKTPDRDVEAVLALSARELVRENAELAKQWQVLSAFPADFDTPAAAAVLELNFDDRPDTDAAENELTALIERSLVQFDAGTNRYSLHDLMRPIAREAFGYVAGHPLQTGSADRLHAAKRRFASYFFTVLDEADELYAGGPRGVLSGLALFDRDAGNIWYSWKWVTEQLREDRRAVELCQDYTTSTSSILLLRLSPPERIAWFTAAVEACQKLGDRWGTGEALWHLGRAHFASGNLRAAISAHELALVVCREYRDARREGQILGSLGAAYAALGDTTEALWLAERAVGLSNQFRDRRLEGEAVAAIGTVYAALGDTRRAISCHQHALVIAREFRDWVAEGNVLGNLGRAHTDAGENHAALGLYEQQLKLTRLVGDRWGEGNALENLGSTWQKLGDARKAIAFYEQRLTIAREIGDQRGDARSSYSMARALHQLGQISEAILLAERALSAFTDVEDPHAEKVRRRLAEWRSESAT